MPLRVIAVPWERGIVFMRGNDSKIASRLKSYGRFLNGFYVLLVDVDFPGPQVNVCANQLPDKRRNSNIMKRQSEAEKWGQKNGSGPLRSKKWGGASYISAKGFCIFLTFSSSSRKPELVCADPNQGPPELPRKAANVKCCLCFKAQSDRRRREKCLRGDPTIDQVINCTRIFHTQLSWHGEII